MKKNKALFPTVGDIAHMGVITASGDATVSDAIALMAKNQIQDVIFENEQGHGIFTVSDLMSFKRSKGKFSTRLDQLGEHQLPYVSFDDNILDVLTEHDIELERYFGVLDNNKKLCGILSYSDILASTDPSLLMETKTIGELLHHASIVSVAPDIPTEEVFTYLATPEDAVIIVKDKTPLGILTTTNAINILQQGDVSLPVSHYMTSPVDVVERHQTIQQVLDYLKIKGFHRAVVVDDDGQLLGAVSQKELSSIAYRYWADLLKSHASQLYELIDTLEDDTQRYKNESLTDPLTGVGNRRHMNESMKAEINRSARYKTETFSFIIFDLDLFKKINDIHGHAKGDEVLQRFCDEVSGILRDSDVLARWGGEEFALLLPLTKLDMAYKLAERIRAHIEHGIMPDLSFTVSAGVGQYQPDESMDALFSRVDAALYQAKEKGRNRVECAQ